MSCADQAREEDKPVQGAPRRSAKEREPEAAALRSRTRLKVGLDWLPAVDFADVGSVRFYRIVGVCSE